MQADADQSTRLLLERDGEIERIEAAIEQACGGAGSLVLIEGAAGVGKTELAMATRLRAGEAGMAVSTARGSELEREFAFGVVRQLLEPAVAAADAARREDLFSGAAAHARPLFMLDPAHGQSAGAEENAATAHHGLYWLCAALAQSRPLLLLVDDAHWADLASLRFLVYLARRLEDIEIALVLATRPAESPAEEEFLVHLSTDPRAVILSPRPLSQDAVEALLGAELGGEAEAPFVAACHAATGGTPFLVRELIRELSAAGVSPVAASVGEIHELGPRAVARSVVARARRLGDGALAVARAIALLGADAVPDRTAALAQVDDATADRALDGLTAAGLIGLGGPIEFAHPILRSAVYREIPARERSRLHLRAARMLAEEGASPERIAAHLLASDPAGDERTVDVMMRVGDAALQRGAPASAVSYLRRALSEPPTRELRSEVLDRLGVAEIRAGELGAATEHLAEARAVAADIPEGVQIARHLVAAHSIQGDYREAAAVIGDLLDHGALERDLVLALSGELLLLALFEPAIRPQVDARLGQTQPALDGRSPGVRTYLSALTMDATLRLRPAAEVRELAARARDAGIVEEVASGAIAWNQVMFPLIFADGFALAQEMTAEGLDHLRERPSVVGSARAHVARSFLQLRRGKLPEAIADARTGAEAAREASFIGRPIAVSVLVDGLIERGEPDAAANALDEAEMAGPIPETFLHSWVVASRARLRLAQGLADEAVAELEGLGRRLDRFNQLNPALVEHRSAHALALLKRGEREAALSVAEVDAELARRWGAPRAIGISLRVLGLCRGKEAAIEPLRESAETLAGSGAELEHARSLIELGAAIRRSGRRSEAREPLHAGMELAHRCGATPLAERAREELLATGARPRRIMRTGVDALTPSELRVARMAAEGMTNREIAEALFVTARTVEGHLTHAFQKLDIDSRRDLPDRLAGEAPG